MGERILSIKINLSGEEVIGGESFLHWDKCTMLRSTDVLMFEETEEPFDQEELDAIRKVGHKRAEHI
jgi:hypothetical protein